MRAQVIARLGLPPRGLSACSSKNCGDLSAARRTRGNRRGTLFDDGATAADDPQPVISGADGALYGCARSEAALRWRSACLRCGQPIPVVVAAAQRPRAALAMRRLARASAALRSWRLSMSVRQRNALAIERAAVNQHRRRVVAATTYLMTGEARRRKRYDGEAGITDGQAHYGGAGVHGRHPGQSVWRGRRRSIFLRDGGNRVPRLEFPLRPIVDDLCRGHHRRRASRPWQCAPTAAPRAAADPAPASDDLRQRSRQRDHATYGQDAASASGRSRASSSSITHSTAIRDRCARSPIGARASSGARRRRRRSGCVTTH